MGDKTKIQWCDATFSPWHGCVKVSEGCNNCYAETFSRRIGFAENSSKFPIWGKDSARRFMSDAHWKTPLKWNRDAEKGGVRKRVFCGSMCDVMEDREDLHQTRERLYRIIEQTPHLDWLLLTKRPQNFRRFLPAEWLDLPRPNVWGLTTVESEDYLWRVEELLKTPFWTRGLSIEPLLGPLCLGRFLQRGEIEVKTEGLLYPMEQVRRALHWVIVGGESGPGARPMHPDWVRSLRDQCVTAGVAFHFKQNGEWVSVSEVEGKGVRYHFPDGATVRRVGKTIAGRTLDGRTWDEFPKVAA